MSPGLVWLLAGVALIMGVPQGLNSLALQNSVYHQADPARMASSAGLMRTFAYLGAIGASAACGAFFTHRADTGGLHRLTWFLLAVSAAFLALTAADRSLRRIGASSRGADRGTGRAADAEAAPAATGETARAAGPEAGRRADHDTDHDTGHRTDFPADIDADRSEAGGS